MKLLNSILSLLRFHKKNWRAVMLSILAATIFWFLNALNKNYTANINFPLKFDYSERNYISVKPLPEEIRLNVTGMGWDLFRKSLSINVPPLVIPLERPSEVKKIVGSTLPALFSQQLDRIKINFVVSDTVYIDIQPRQKRWLSLSVDSVEQFIRNNFGIVDSVSITPDSISIEGPINIVSDLPEPFPLQLNDKNIDEDFDEEVEVRLPHNQLINRIPPFVRVSFDVDRFVNVTDTVKLEIKNIPKNALPKMEVDKLPVTVRVLEGSAGSIPWDSVKAVIDLQNFKKGDIKVLPTIQGIPGNVQIISLDTVYINY